MHQYVNPHPTRKGHKNQSNQHTSNPTLFSKFKQGTKLGGNIVIRERTQERERETHTHTP
jgi:hypothetical protein